MARCRVIVLLVVLLAAMAAVAQTVVTFEDPGLESVVREALEIPSDPIHDSDLETLTFLDAGGRNIQSLEGLQHAINLEIFYAYDNQLTDLAPLSGLSNLTDLRLYTNTISDLTPIAGLTSLETLWLHENAIADLTPLAGLTNLKNLDLDGNDISDLGPLANLVNLESLFVAINQIADLSPLAGLTGLQLLSAGVNDIEDITALANLTNLQTLFLGENNIVDLTGLTDLINLMNVDLGANAVVDLQPLVENAGLGSGDSLNLVGNPLGNLALCEQLPVLESRAFESLSYAGTCTGPVPTVVIGSAATTVTNSGPVAFPVTYSDAASVDLTPADIELVFTETAAGTAFVENGTTNTPAIVVEGLHGDGTLAIRIQPGTSENAAGTDNGSNTSDAVTIDNTPPTVAIGSPSANITTMGPVTFPLSYAGAAAVNLTESDVMLITAGTVTAGMSVINGTTASPRVRLIDITGGGTVAIQIAAGTATDEAGNTAAAAGPSDPVTVDSAAGIASFDDPRLETAVRDALNMPSGPILETNLDALTHLDAAGRGIELLGGIEYAQNLLGLNLSYNQLEILDALLTHETLGEGAAVDLYGNPLTEDTVCNVLPTLRARGIALGFNGDCGPVERGRIVGVISDTLGASIACAAISITETGRVVGAAVADATGYYEIAGLVQGVTYSLEFVAPGHTNATRDHTLASNEDQISIDLVPALSSRIDGFVTDDSFDRQPVPGALVVAYQGAREAGRTVTCASGAFEFQSLDLTKQLRVTLEVSAPGFVTRIAEVNVDETQPVEIELKGISFPGSITGTVVDADHHPVPSADITIQSTPAGVTKVSLSGIDGGYATSNVPPGHYTVRAVVAGMGMGTNTGQVNDTLELIDVELMSEGNGACTPPAPPTGVTASDGSDAAAVIVEWDPTTGDAIEYRVFRASNANVSNATPVSNWITAVSYTDTTAAPPTVGNSGCNGTPTTTFHTYYYWVVARNAGAACESNPSDNDTGFRGVNSVQSAGAPTAAIFMAVCAILLCASKPARRRHAGND